MLKFSKDNVYIVYLDKNFKVKKFVALKSKDKLIGVHPKLIENYNKIISRKDELAEQKGRQ